MRDSPSTIFNPSLSGTAEPNGKADGSYYLDNGTINNSRYPLSNHITPTHAESPRVKPQRYGYPGTSNYAILFNLHSFYVCIDFSSSV